MILIVTHSARDITVVRLRKVLEAQASEFVIIDPAAMEGLSSLLLVHSQTGPMSCQLFVDGRVIDFSEIRSAWLWRSWQRFPDEPALSGLAAKQHEWTFFRSEWLAFHKGLCLALQYSGVFCVNPPPFNIAFEEKYCQMLVAAQVGFVVPPTLYTTRLPLVREFYDQHNGAVIYKPFTAYARLLDETPEQPLRTSKLYTSRVKGEHLDEPDGFTPTPGIFQPYIEKQLELRVVVIGRQIFACAIHSQQSQRTREDWRRYDLDQTPHEPYELPPEITARVLALMDRLQLVFGSIDLIVTPQGEYVFLEINPNGQFDWIAHMTGMPLYEHLVAMLKAGRVDYPTPTASEVSHAQ